MAWERLIGVTRTRTTSSSRPSPSKSPTVNPELMKPGDKTSLSTLGDAVHQTDPRPRYRNGIAIRKSRFNFGKRRNYDFSPRVPSNDSSCFRDAKEHCYLIARTSKLNGRSCTLLRNDISVGQTRAMRLNGA